jgi:FtsZ-interacting cell division protein ZipA
MELRTALFIIGVIVVALIAFISYYRAQQQPYKLPRKMRRFSRHEDDGVDPLFEPRKGPAGMQQPVDDVPGDTSVAPAEEVVSREDSVEAVPLARDDIEEDASPTLQLDLQPSEKKVEQGPEKSIEYVALIRGADTISRDRALSVYRMHEYKMEKRNSIFGFNIASGLWCDLEREEQTAEFRDICLSIQLDDHTGPVSESELHRFSQMSLEVAEELDRPIIFSMDFDEALGQANDLDQFRKEMDVIFVISLVARSDNGLKLPAIHREAEKQGLVYGKDKIYQRIRLNADNETEVMFSMANMFKPGELPKDDDSIHTSGLTFFMRFVAVPNPVDIYVDMVNTATSMAKKLNCILVDQETRPLNESMTTSQTKSISKMVGRMDARQIPAGSELAKRLF